MPILVVEEGPSKGAECVLPETGDCIVGRSTKCTLTVLDSKLSRQHFSIRKVGKQYEVRDLGSSNGTYLNNKKLVTSEFVLPSAKITVGESVISIRMESGGYLTGKTIAGCRLDQHIGGGGMGEVYRAHQVSLGRTVAIKVLSKELSSNTSFINSFVAEARAAGQLNNPNVVQIFDVGSDNGIYFITMEYLAGGSIGEVIDDDGPIEVSRVLEIATHACRALAYAEEQGIVHCDIKPDNLLIGEDGEVRLVDLGIAKKSGDSALSDNSSVLGSPHYMSPEQAKGERLDHRSDLYSLGATLYHMLAGQPVFTSGKPRDIMKSHVYDAPPPLKDVAPDTPASLVKIVHKLLEKSPKTRYQSANEVITALTTAQKTRAASPKARAVPRTKRETGPQERVAPPAGFSFVQPLLVLAVVGIIGLFAYSYFSKTNAIDATYAEGLDLEAEASALYEKNLLPEAEKKYEAAIQKYRNTLAMSPDATLTYELKDAIKQIKERLEFLTKVENLEAKLQTLKASASAGGRPLALAYDGVSEIHSRGARSAEISEELYNELRERLFAQAAKDLNRRTVAAMDYLRLMSFDRAISEINKFPDYYDKTDAAKDKVAVLNDIKTEATRLANKRLEEAEALIEELKGGAKNISKIKTILSPLRRQEFLPSARAGAEKLVRESENILENITEQRVNTDTENQKKNAEFLLRYAILLENTYDFNASRKMYRKASSAHRKLGDASVISITEKALSRTVRRMLLFDELCNKIAQRQLNTSHRIDVVGIGRGRVITVDKRKQTFVLRTNGPNREVLWAQIPPSQMVTLFEAMKPTADDRVLLTEFCIDHGLKKDAERMFLYIKGRIKPDYRDLYDELKERVNDTASPAEEDAATLVDVALKAVRDGDIDDAKKWQKILQTRYKNTDAAAERKDELKEAIAN